MQFLPSFPRISPKWYLPIISIAFLAIYSVCCFAQMNSPDSTMEGRLLVRVASRPDDASSWRLLGRLRLRRGDISGALAACGRAVDLDPLSASANYDLGRAWLVDQEYQKAEQHFQLVTTLAPQSDYSVQAMGHLERLQAIQTVSGISPLDADLEPNRFGGSPTASRVGSEQRRFDFRVDLGTIYNSNVQLAPLSRVISSPGLASFQGFLSPQLEYRFLTNDLWRGGVSFSGYFNVNESDNSQFDLQDYQPGAFFERSFFRGESEIVARMQYDFTLDEFSGNTFGRRHAITSMLSFNRLCQETVIYWTIDYSNFADDGATPAISSLDGWTNTLGTSHSWLPEFSRLELLRAGVDLQWAPLDGSDFAYHGVYLYGEGEVPLPWQSSLVLQFGWGLRNYPDFSSTPSRDETLWRGSVTLRKPLSDHWSLAVLFTYDQFSSDNPQFDTSRYLSGVMTTYRF